MNRGTEMTVVRIAPTRDGGANPSGRLADKHSRLLCGKTLDEWWAIQSWASKHITRSVLVGETAEHGLLIHERLRHAEQECPGLLGNLTVLSRPASMNHPTQDSGGFPTNYGYQWLKKALPNINLVVCDFVVSPLRLPGDLDRMIELFAKKLGDPTPDGIVGVECMTSCAHTEYPHFRGLGDRMVYDSVALGNLRFADNLVSASVFNCMSARYYEAQHHAAALQLVVPGANPWRFDVQPWQELHVDYGHEWELAEYWFEKKIGGVEAYKEYRKSWASVSAPSR